MILYEYKCNDCHNVFDVWETWEDWKVDKSSPECPYCKSVDTIKQFSPPGIIWKTDGNVGKIGA